MHIARLTLFLLLRQAGKQRRSIVDGLGRLKTVVEDPVTLNYQTNYTYDALGNLIQVDQGSQQRIFTYDNLSRLKTAKNPEQVNTSSQMVATTYDYDDASNLLSRTNPNGTTVGFTYDGMNRVKTKTLSIGGTWTYTYDVGTNFKGRLVSVNRGASGTDGCYYDGYDAMGRVTASHQTTTTTQSGTQRYTLGYGYDLAGNNTSQVYPSGKEYRTVFDSAGRISSASRYISSVFDKTYASQFQYTPHGGVSSMSLGNNTAETMQYNSRLQPTMIELRKTDNSLILGLDYTYGATSANNGNIATQAIRIGSGGTTTTINQSYGYDNLNRLHTASETGSWSQTYNFDQYGNRWVSQSTGYTVDASLCPTQQSHISAVTNRIVMTGFSYDFSGNQKTQIRNGQNENYDYDSENHLVSINSGGTGSYVYDGDGRRVKKTDSTGTTVFVYNAGGQLIAEYHSDPVPPAAGGGGTSYLTSDHLGSTRVVTKSDGTVKARYDYLPFGEELGAAIGQRTVGMGYSAADSTRQKFTQKERDSESGLDYFLARYYSSAQGRFTSVDPLLASGRVEDAQSWNRYIYAFNNPLRYIDPLGLWNWDTSAGGSSSDDELRRKQKDKSLSKDERKAAERALKFRENFRSAHEAAVRAEPNPNLTTEQQAQVQESVAAYGSENDSNGVNVGVRRNVRGSAATTLVNEDDTITVTFNEGLKDDKLAVVSTHEGRHVADGMAWLATHLTGGPTDLNHWEREWNAWFVSSYVAQGLGLKKYGPDGGGSEYQVWSRGWKEVDRSINRLAGVARILQYSSLSRTDTDTYSREHHHRP